MNNEGRLVIILRKDEVVKIGEAKVKIVGLGGRDKYKMVIVADKKVPVEKQIYGKDND